MSTLSTGRSIGGDSPRSLFPAPMQPDYYALLGLTHSATADDIRRAYGRLSEKLAPGAATDPATGHRFAEIKAAYEVLSDANRRTLYDLESMERDLAASERELATDLFGPLSVDPSAGGKSFEEDLATVLAEIQRPRTATTRAPSAAHGDSKQSEGAGRARRGSDLEIVLEVTLEEAVRGATVPATYSLSQRRSGANDDAEHKLDIHVPKLARHGQRLLIKGKGAPGRDGGNAGDLHVEIVYKGHPLFRLNGDDVWYHFPIAPWEAVLGAVLELPTLEDPFRVHVPAGTTSGQTFRLPGRGLPKADGGRGDLLACLRIVTPKTPTETEKQLYRELSRASRFNPRRGLS